MATSKIAEGVQTDTPTSDIETHALVAVFAACHGTAVFVGHQKRIFAGDASRPHSNNASTARRATWSRPCMKHFCSSEYLFSDSAIAVEAFGRRSTATRKRSSRIFPAFYFHIEKGALDVVLTTRRRLLVGVYRVRTCCY